MHEASELVQAAAPIASAGGVAALIGFVRARQLRRVRVVSQTQPPRDGAHTEQNK